MPFIRNTIFALVVSGLVGGPAAAKDVCYFGVCKDVPSAPADQTPAPKSTPGPEQPPGGGLKVLASFGSWQVVVDGQGRRMIVDTFDDGSKLLIAKDGGDFAILIREPTWQLREGESIDVKVDVDGDTYTGTSTALDGSTIAMAHLSADFVKALYHGDHARIVIGDDSWSFDLANAAKAIDAAAGLDSTTTS